MWTILKIVGEVGAFILLLYGFYAGGVISSENAITIGIISVVFVLCHQELKKSLNPINNALSEIQKWLGENFDFVPLHEVKPTGFIQNQSPIEMTDLGTNLLNESGAKNVIDDNYRELEASFVDCKTALDVQEMSSRIIAKRENDPIMDSLKSFVYNNPRFQGSVLTFVDIQKVMTIYLRNTYLKNNPHIPR